MRRVGFVGSTMMVVAVVTGAAQPVCAEPLETRMPEGVLLATALTLVRSVPAAPELRSGPHTQFLQPQPPGRPAALVPLYVGFAALQGLDAHSTHLAVRAGHPEVNPLMAPLAERPVLMVGTKVAAASATVVLAERLWKRNRVAAVTLMVAANAGYALAVSHNYRQASR